MVSLRSFRVVAALAAVLAAWPAAAQPAAGKLAGVVKDQTGAPVPGATITVAHATTHAHAQTVTTGTDGSYSVGLPPGLYTVSVALKGFGGPEPAGGGGSRLDRGLHAGAAQLRRRSPSPP